jgi:hypothetical protein
LDHCRDEKEYDEVFQNTQFIGFICGDKIEEYEEVFINTQFIGSFCVMKKNMTKIFKTANSLDFIWW